ncbi:hypothetical protein D7I43_32030 [Micromonospora globbae]|uniref:Peptidase inhibitor family I36 n=1 Tax=Micromonospora globbae TaxID=1894969 RepID=A0A420EEP1_9ACTN|nr:hypothetical protein D7I43_32030 [Micromonospora globbae]
MLIAALTVFGLTMVVSPTAAHADDSRCTTNYSGWWCLYDAKSYGSAPYLETVCTTSRVSLEQWFWDDTSSWRHRQTGGAYVYAYDWTDLFGAIHLWTMSGQSQDGDVSPYDNMMDSFRNYC